jgi:hypothetical protein
VGLRKLEEALANLLEGTFDRAFPGTMHPVEVTRALWQAMLDHRVVVGGVTRVPNRLCAILNPLDLQHLREAQQRLEQETARGLEQESRLSGWNYGAKVLVRLTSDESVRSGRVSVEAQIDESPLQAALMFENGFAAGQRCALRPGVVLGRASDVDLLVPDGNVSRHHCRFDWRFEGYQISDLGSRNGTFVNGVRVFAYVLSDNDVVGVGASQLRFRYEV